MSNRIARYRGATSPTPVRAVLFVAFVVALVLVGCTRASTAAEQRAKCFANEALVGAEMRVFKLDSGIDAPLQTVLEKTHAVCPSGGTYSYDTTTGIVDCSVHGHPK